VEEVEEQSSKSDAEVCRIQEPRTVIDRQRDTLLREVGEMVDGQPASQTTTNLKDSAKMEADEERLQEEAVEQRRDAHAAAAVLLLVVAGSESKPLAEAQHMMNDMQKALELVLALALALALALKEASREA
jgi:hypothetical protein